MFNTINSYINPFSKDYQVADTFNSLTVPQQVFVVVASIFAGLGSFILGGFATFRALSERFKVDQIPPSKNKTVNTIHTTLNPALTIEKPENVRKTNLKGSICITTQTGGYIGDPLKRQLLPSYLMKRNDSNSPLLTLEDGSPLPLNAEDFFIEFHVFDRSNPLTRLNIPSPFMTPIGGIS